MSWAIALTVEAEGTSEKSDNLFHTTQRNNLEDGHLRTSNLTRKKLISEATTTSEGLGKITEVTSKIRTKYPLITSQTHYKCDDRLVCVLKPNSKAQSPF